MKTLFMIVFRSARFKIQVSGFDRVTWVNLFFKKSKQRRFNNNKKNQQVVTEFYWVSCVTPGFFFTFFFFNPTLFQPRIDLLGRAGFQNYTPNNILSTNLT
jgi:hypothetical protein